MIAAGSLSAFSTANAPLPAARAPGGPMLHPVRTPATPAQAQPSPPQPLLQPGAPAPARPMPRGSLLDLSV
jgi:hypothetical protein